jgi:hypothetical protein
MDFMQCINFKSRLDREREMIRRKIRSSTLYRKPSFTKSAGFNIYNTNGEVTKVSCITKNLKINELKDEPIRKVKSPLLVNDEQADDCANEEKSILCIGSKYLDITSNLMAPISKSVSTSTINLNPNDLANEKLSESDCEKAISQSHLSPSSPSSLSINCQQQNCKKLSISEHSMQEHLKKPKTANTHHHHTLDDLTNNNHITNSLPTLILTKSDHEKTSDGEDVNNNRDTNSPSTDKKRKEHKIYRKSAQNFFGHKVGKYSDAQKTEVADDLPNSITEQSNILTNNNNTNILNHIKPLINTTSAVSSGANTARTAKKSAMSRKKSKKSDTHKSTATTRKSESSQMA